MINEIIEFIKSEKDELYEHLLETKKYKSINGNLVFISDDSKILLLSHIDTYNNLIWGEKGVCDEVFFIEDLNVILQKTYYLWLLDKYEGKIDFNILFAEHNSRIPLSTSLGADDRLGVYLCDWLTTHYPHYFSTIITDNEEIGYCTIQYIDKKFFRKFEYIIALDRGGMTYTYKNKKDEKLEKILRDKKYTYLQLEDRGTIYDYINTSTHKIQYNLGIGYYFPHTPREFANIQILKQTANTLLQLAQSL